MAATYMFYGVYYIGERGLLYHSILGRNLQVFDLMRQVEYARYMHVANHYPLTAVIKDHYVWQRLTNIAVNNALTVHFLMRLDVQADKYVQSLLNT